MENSDLLKKAETLAYQYEKKYGGCAQCVLGALKNTIGGISDDVFKAGTGLAGGVALNGAGTCGALSGGVMALSMYLGRNTTTLPTSESRTDSAKICKKLVDRFETEFGSGNCKDIQRRVMGRSFNLWNKQDTKTFLPRADTKINVQWYAAKRPGG